MYKDKDKDVNWDSTKHQVLATLACLLRKHDDAFVAIAGVLRELEGICLYRDVINKIDPRGGKTNGKNGPSQKAAFGGRDKKPTSKMPKKVLGRGGSLKVRVCARYYCLHCQHHWWGAMGNTSQAMLCLWIRQENNDGRAKVEALAEQARLDCLCLEQASDGLP